jgi:hypothetical protein
MSFSDAFRALAATVDPPDFADDAHRWAVGAHAAVATSRVEVRALRAENSARQLSTRRPARVEWSIHLPI